MFLEETDEQRSLRAELRAYFASLHAAMKSASARSIRAASAVSQKMLSIPDGPCRAAGVTRPAGQSRNFPSSGSRARPSRSPHVELDPT